MKNYYFSPTWSLLIFISIVGFVCFCLGVWQLNRAEEKETLAKIVSNQLKLAPVRINEQQKNIDKFHYVSAEGRFLPSHTFFLDDVVYDRKHGYHVVSILELENSNDLLIVNRGWIEGGADRSVPPNVTTSDNLNLLNGTLVAPRERPFFIKDVEESDSKLRLYIEIEKIERVLGRPVLPLVMQLKSELDDGLVRDWPKYDAKVSMHIGYAVQWFAFALFAFILSIYTSFKRKK